jgi:hypothetical protein
VALQQLAGDASRARDVVEAGSGVAVRQQLLLGSVLQGAPPCIGGKSRLGQEGEFRR